MKTKGIRISDKIDHVVSVNLPDVLKELYNGNSYKWSILFLEGHGHIEGKSIPVLQKEIFDSPRGLFINWNELKLLGSQYEQIYDLVLIGCNDESLLKCYENDQEMYETCDIVIVMFDSSYWEIFSKDEQFIQRLASKFRDIKFLESDFQKDFEIN